MGKIPEKIFELIDKTHFGDMILIEYEPFYAAELVTMILLEYARKGGLSIIIDDNLDCLHIVKEHLRFLGIEEDFKDAFVIKTGGKLNIGTVVGRVKIESEPAIYIKRYEEISSKTFTEVDRAVNIVLGLERLFAFVQNTREFYTLIGSIQSFLGNEKRKAFYIIDKNVALSLKYNLLPELERIASTVVYISGEHGEGKVIFKKSPYSDLVGQEFKFSLKDLIG
ncbi:hypothetical protein PAP_01480 [Palaeococcus pacificus DY20341]|uniref:KaiC-like domain-containing protein n=1 Tax=Palaeococcus pacificus DY20341 TaxID=1343739 RepID=A0A075LRK1_9EURY|nr:hypothetical protein PAP_01480 [Palaeococcus pacificus DY20341]